MLLTFSDEQVCALLPAFLHIDQKLKITAMGPGIPKHLPEVQIGMALADAFDILNYDVTQFFKAVSDIKPLQLVSKCGKVNLFGAALIHDGGYLLAVRFAMSDQMLASGDLHLSDFGHADPVIQSTLLIALQRAMLDDAQATAVELAHERKRGEELLDRMSRIAGYMAHDFNNLLSIIKLNTDRLLRSFGSDDRISNLANIIQVTAARGSDITQSLMTISQQRTDTLSPIGIDDIIRENSAFLVSVAGAGIDLIFDLQAGDRKSVISYNGFLNCIINLLINAREAMPQGGRINLSTSVSRGLVGSTSNDHALHAGEFIAIRIADNGTGLNESLLSRAFEPLFSSKPNGSGLGLASVRDFAVDMGGDVWLESQAGEGATVYLHLPVAEGAISTATMPELSAAPEQHAQVPGKKSILLVEDEPYALEALLEMLEGEGYAVTPCSTADQAMCALEQNAYHLLLSDIVMPGQNGTDIARQACAGQPSIKVILMSGYVPDSASLQPGWMFLRKPMDSGELLTLISNAV